jgi:hypothetical protein
MFRRCQAHSRHAPQCKPPKPSVNLTPGLPQSQITPQPAPREAGVKIRPLAVKKPLRQALSAGSRDALGVW